MAIKGPVQRGMPDQDAKHKNFLARRLSLSVARTAPFLHLHGRALVFALLNAASGLPPFPSLRSQQALAPLADILVALTVAPSAAQTGGFTFTAPASPFVFGVSTNDPVASTVPPADGTAEGTALKKKGRKKRQHAGGDLPGEMAAPAIATTLT